LQVSGKYSAPWQLTALTKGQAKTGLCPGEGSWWSWLSGKASSCIYALLGPVPVLYNYSGNKWGFKTTENGLKV